MKHLYLLFLAVCLAGLSVAQPVVNSDTVVTQSRSEDLNVASQKVVSSFSKGSSNDQIAEDYYKLALQLINLGDYVKAETYLLKAIELASENKNNKKIAEYYRELAKVQEYLKKDEDAVENFKWASAYSDDKSQKRINTNDANRIKSRSNPDLELEYLNQNAYIWSNSTNNREIVQTYNQMAEVNKSMNNPDEALLNYQNALSNVDDQSTEAILIKSDMANLLVESNNYTDAINIQKQVVEQSWLNADVEIQVKQMRQLSDMYFANNSAAEGLQVLKDSYNLAIEKGNVKEARQSLLVLIEFYEKNKDNEEILQLYRDFILKLDTLISKDKSLIDIKLFEITEEKITQLEKEKQLKDELIDRKNNYNLMLAGSVILLAGLSLLTVMAWRSVKKRNRLIALQSLRREMNPHFIFNSLNSVNQFIANNNELEANKYLTSYSNLMRRFMENSNSDYVSLSVEIDQLTKYLDLEKLRFPDKFDYKIEIDDNLDVDAVKIPNMIIQPNVENSIWHGLRYKDSKGYLRISFNKENKKTVVIIEDNGIGLEESQKMKTKNQKMHESRGLMNVRERINLLNEINKSGIRFEINAKTVEETGVIVKIAW